MNGFDALLVLIVVLGGIIGGKLGFFRSLSSFAGFFLAAVMTRWLSPHAVKLIADSSNINERISEWISGKTGIQQWESQYQMWMQDPEVKSALAQQGFGSLGSILGQQSSMVDTGARIILLVATSIVLFIVFKLVFRYGFKLLDSYSRKLPIQNSLNKVGGMILGVLTAGVIAILATVVWSPVSSAAGWGDKPFLNTKDSWFANQAIPLLGIDEVIPLNAASEWFMPMIARNNHSAQPVYAEKAADQELITLADWFGTAPGKYEEKELSAAVDCHSGSCPEWKLDTEYQTYDCWFCSSEWVGIQGNQFKIDSEGSVGSDTLAGCTKRTEGPILRGMTIVDQTDDLLVVRGSKVFNKLQSGGCDTEYDAAVDVTVEWRFRKEPTE